jgi:serine/threonine-protein kinase
VARALVLVGDIYRSQGRASEAVPLLERALGILATHDVQSSQIAEAELHLGAALWTIASDDRRAIELVTSARRRFATEPEAQEKNLAQADTWLREHPRPR